jgi:colanic acid/amylovoran biosynthesis glycosyltransferase
MRIAYLCAQYPAVSHTFILREVDALRRRGVEIDTFSVRRAGADHLLADADRAAFASTFAIRPPRVGKLCEAHLKLALSSPAGYASTLARALRLAPAGPRGRLWQIFYFVQAVLLWSECRKRGIRHIHAHLANVAADLALLAAHIGSACEPERPWSWSFTMHGPTEFFDVRHYRLAEKLNAAGFVVCISDYARSQMMSLGELDSWQKLSVVHAGLPLEQFTPNGAGPAGGETAGGPPRILCVGRLVPEKGQAVLLEALAMLVARGREVAVTFAGEGPSRAALEALAARLGIAERAAFLGSVGQDEIRALYSQAEIFCLPSFAEGIPVVLMEAMAMRRPVVSTRITGIPELIEEAHNGLLVAAGRADELADALERLLEDSDLRRELGANARRKIVEEFDVERSATQLRDLFERQLTTTAESAALGGGR